VNPSRVVGGQDAWPRGPTAGRWPERAVHRERSKRGSPRRPGAASHSARNPIDHGAHSIPNTTRFLAMDCSSWPPMRSMNRGRTR